MILPIASHSKNLDRYEEGIMQKLRSGDRVVMKNIDYVTLTDIIDTYRNAALDKDISFMRLFLLGDEIDRYYLHKHSDEVPVRIRKKAARSLSYGMLNRDPRVRLSCIHLLYKVGVYVGIAKDLAERAVRKETVDTFYSYVDIYGRVRTKSIRRELLRLLDHSEDFITLLEPVPTSQPFRYLYGSEHSLITYDQSFTFEWSHVPGAYIYELYIDDDIAYVGRKTICYFQKSLKVGRAHNWHVVALLENGDEIKSKMNIIHVRELLRPKLTVVQKDMSDARPYFTWDKVRGALTYELYLYGRGLLYKVAVPHGRNVKTKIKRPQWEFSDVEFIPPSKRENDEEMQRYNTYDADKRKIVSQQRDYTNFKPSSNLPSGNYLCYVIAKNGFQTSLSHHIAFVISNDDKVRSKINRADEKKLPKAPEKAERKSLDDLLGSDSFDEDKYLDYKDYYKSRSSLDGDDDFDDDDFDDDDFDDDDFDDDDFDDDDFDDDDF